MLFSGRLDVQRRVLDVDTTVLVIPTRGRDEHGHVVKTVEDGKSTMDEGRDDNGIVRKIFLSLLPCIKLLKECLQSDQYHFPGPQEFH